MDGKPLSLIFAQVSPTRRVSLAYSFQYFQEYDEPMQLPAGFEPTRVGVEIHSGRTGCQPQFPAGLRLEGAGNVGRNGGERRYSGQG